MMESINGYCPELIIHPGETLKEVLEGRGMTQKELAIRTGFSEKHISTIIGGKKKISDKFAKSLEYVLEIDASFWSNLQSEYEQEIISFNEANSISREEISVLGNLKQIIEYFVSKGILKEEDSNSIRVLKLRGILNVRDLTYIPQLSMQGAFRASESSSIDPYVLCAWQKICEEKFKEIEVEKNLDMDLLEWYIPKIKKLMFKDPNIMRDELKTIFAECGIAFDIVRHFRGAPVQGFIRRTEDGKMLLCITLRQAFADIFWFTLFHEIAHILNGDVKNYFCDFDFKQDETEIKADEFASNVLIAPDAIKKFMDRGDYSLDAIKKFAVKEDVPPFIVIGRLQKEEEIDYSWYTDAKPRYKWV